jgi:serine/threonine protein kinase
MQVGDTVERYRIEAQVGRGATASVYRARHVTLGSLHAIKLLDGASPSLRDRLIQEGRALSRLRHPNVVAISDAIAVGDRPALVMEFVDGPDLAELIRHRRLHDDEIDALVEDLLAGLAAAHAAGLVHRDLKPANILVDLAGSRPVARISDFGLVKVLDAEAGHVATRTGSTLGTPAYMSPEQLRDPRAVDARADVWSIGCVLYELVTGARAFDGTDAFALLESVAYGRRRPIGELAPGCPPRFASAIEAALVVDREARVASAEALLALWRGDRGALPATAWDIASIRSARPVIETRSESDDTIDVAPDREDVHSAPTYAEPPAPADPVIPELPAPRVDTVSLLGGPPEAWNPDRPVVVDARPPFAILASGLLFGAIAAAALMVPWWGVTLASYVGDPLVPAMVGYLAWPVAAASVIAAGWAAGRRWRAAIPAGGVAGAVAGGVVHIAAAWPVLAALGSAPVFSVTERTADGMPRVLAQEVANVLGLEWGGALLLILVGAALGAAGGAIVTVGRDRDPGPDDPGQARFVAAVALAGTLAAALLMPIVFSAMDVMFDTMALRLAADVTASVVLDGVRGAMVVGWMATLAVSTAATWGAGAARVAGRDRREAIGTGALASLAAVGSIAFDRFVTPHPGTLLVAGMLCTLLAAVLAPVAAWRLGRRAPDPHVYALDPQGTAVSLVGSAVAAMGVAFIGAVIPGLAIALTAVTHIAWLKGDADAADPTSSIGVSVAVAARIGPAIGVLLLLLALATWGMASAWRRFRPIPR